MFSDHQHVCLPFCPFLCVSVCLSVCKYVCLSVCVSIQSFIHPSVCPSVHQSDHQSVYYNVLFNLSFASFIHSTNKHIYLPNKFWSFLFYFPSITPTILSHTKLYHITLCYRNNILASNPYSFTQESCMMH